MRSIETDEAYIAVDQDGFVEGACFTQSEDADRWISDMEQAGMSVEVRSRVEAKRVLFTHIEKPLITFAG